MGFGNVAAERAAIESTYEDTATVTRTTDDTGDDKITRPVSDVIYSEIICALSKSGTDKSEQAKANKIDYDAVIFFCPEVKILPGDSVVVKRFGRENPDSQIVLNFKVVGRPAYFATHQEVKAKDGDLA